MQPHPETQQELDGIELLLQMAKTGQIDPWNIDICQVADEYLKAVSELKQSDLKITGKTLLTLAILLRMKSDGLAGINYLDPPEEFIDELEPDFLEEDAVQRKLRIKSLDEVLIRRTSTKQHRIRTVTLNDLIRELKKYEILEQQRSLRDKVEKIDRRRNNDMRDYEDFTADDIEEMAHEEFIEDTILNLRDILERLLEDDNDVSLTELTELGKLDKISAFLAVLFLTARGGFNLHQEAFYEELYIQKSDDSQMIASGDVKDDDDEEETAVEAPIHDLTQRINFEQQQQFDEEDGAELAG